MPLARRCFCRLLRPWLIVWPRGRSPNRSNAFTWPAATTTRLAPVLAEQGWAVLELLAQPLPVQVAAIRAAERIAGFGEKRCMLWPGWELQPEQGPQLLLLGGRPSLDLLLQFRAQGLNGWYLPCADDAGVEVIEELNACLL